MCATDSDDDDDGGGVTLSGRRLGRLPKGIPLRHAGNAPLMIVLMDLSAWEFRAHIWENSAVEKPEARALFTCANMWPAQPAGSA